MDWDKDAIIAWLFRDGRLMSTPRSFVEHLGRQMIALGAPVWRVRLGCRTIHPLIASWSVLWSHDMAEGTERVATHGFTERDTYIGSPMAHVTKTGTAFRRRLTNLDEAHDHRLMFELAAKGATDYLALPMTFSDGAMSNLVVVSDGPDGFSDADITKFTELVPFIAPIFEVFAVRMLARTLLDTYVGPRTGRRVLSGQIKRGDGEIIHAAIWISDLRDFTPLTETLEPKDLLELLNSYFEAVAAAVTARGGEILSFIGDAMLIVFPVTPTTSPGDACSAAVDAVNDALSGVAATNMRRKRSNLPAIEFGVGLHLGEVIYGNVGTPDRLDFTVMGPAVNRCARLESLTKQLGSPLLMSGEVARSIHQKTVSCGFHDLKGVAEQQEVYALAAAN